MATLKKVDTHKPVFFPNNIFNPRETKISYKESFNDWVKGEGITPEFRVKKYPVEVNFFQGTYRLESFPAKIKSEELFVDATEEYFHQADKRLDIKIGDRVIDSLNPNFQELYEAINKSKYILDLNDNWDEDGAKGYKESTWIKTVNFLVTYFNAAYDLFGEMLKSPKIYHGPDSGIDLLWKIEDKYRLLIKIPEESDVISFYGDDYGSTKFQGTIDLSTKANKGLILTLLECK